MSGHNIQFRDYQVAARDSTFGHYEAGTESCLAVLPTGTGKTVLAGMFAEKAMEEYGRKTLFVAHREVLIEQAYKTFCRFGFNVAIEMGRQSSLAHEATIGACDVIVGSVQSLQDDRLMRHNPEEFGLIVIDECHRALTDGYTKMLNWFRGYWLAGITATPGRGDRRNLGSRFAVKSFEYRLRNAIQDNWLVPIKVRECPVQIDLRKVKMAGDDFAIGDLEARIGPNIEALARGLLKEAGDRKAVVFTPDVGSAMAFAQVFSDLGAPSRYVAGTGGKFGMRKSERKDNLAAFAANEFRIVTCCELLIEGWDEPAVEAVGILRPTLQQYRYMQMVGRGTRPSPETGKTDCLVIDFDWLTDKESKDLCSTVDIFDDGSLDEEVFAIAKGIAAASPKEDADPLELIEEAEQILNTRRKFRISLTGREAKYEAMTYDPIGVGQILDIKLNRRYDLDKKGENPASAKQLAYLRSLGMSTPEGLSKWGATKMIDKIAKRREQGLASPEQVKRLLSSGVESTLARSMTATDASGVIADLNKYRTIQRNLFT